MTSDEERMAMLAGRPLDALDDDERSQVASWTRLLADDAIWVEPAPDLEDLVVASVDAAPRPTHRVGQLQPAARPRGCGRCWPAWPRPRPSSPRCFLLSHRGDKEASFATGAADRDRAGHRRHGPDRDLRGHVGLPDRAARPTTSRRWTTVASTRPGSRARQGTVPIGTFSEGDGDWVTLWSGVSPVDYPTVTVTDRGARRQPGLVGPEGPERQRQHRLTPGGGGGSRRAGDRARCATGR